MGRILGDAVYDDQGFELYSRLDAKREVYSKEQEKARELALSALFDKFENCPMNYLNKDGSLDISYPNSSLYFSEIDNAIHVDSDRGLFHDKSEVFTYLKDKNFFKAIANALLDKKELQLPNEVSYVLFNYVQEMIFNTGDSCEEIDNYLNDYNVHAEELFEDFLTHYDLGISVELNGSKNYVLDLTEQFFNQKTDLCLNVYHGGQIYQYPVSQYPVAKLSELNGEVILPKNTTLYEVSSFYTSLDVQGNLLNNGNIANDKLLNEDLLVTIKPQDVVLNINAQINPLLKFIQLEKPINNGESLADFNVNKETILEPKRKRFSI